MGTLLSASSVDVSFVLSPGHGKHWMILGRVLNLSFEHPHERRSQMFQGGAAEVRHHQQSKALTIDLHGKDQQRKDAQNYLTMPAVFMSSLMGSPTTVNLRSFQKFIHTVHNSSVWQLPFLAFPSERIGTTGTVEQTTYY